MEAPSTMSAAAGAPARRRGGGVVDRHATAYDFRRPIQLSREHGRILQTVFDAFARQATTIFTSTLRTVCTVTLAATEQRSYAEYVDSLGSMTYLTKFSAEPLPGLGVLEMPLPAVMSCVDHMLGGPGTQDQPERALTDIESVVITGLVERLLDGLRYAVSELVAIDPVACGVEYSPQFAQVASGNDVMVATTLAVRINDHPHRLTVCMPFNGLLPHLTAAAAPAPVSSRERAERTAAAEVLNRRFLDVPVDVSVRFRRTQLSPAVFAALSPGDVLRFEHPASAPLDVIVDETVFAHATPGATGQSLAARIVSTPQEPR